MIALKKMNNVEKGKLLADLLPEELPNISAFIKQRVAWFTQHETEIKEGWKNCLFTANFWYQLVQQIDHCLKQYGNQIHNNHRLFADQLFNGYDALFTVDCLVKYAEKEECKPKLKEAIHFLFGGEIN
jgi:hypothetical protein